MDFDACCMKELRTWFIIYFHWVNRLYVQQLWFISALFSWVPYEIVYTRIILKRLPSHCWYSSFHKNFWTRNLTSQLCRYTHTCAHAQGHSLPMPGLPLPPPGSSWNLPLLIFYLPPVKRFLLSQNCSSKYFMKQLDRSFSVVLACPKASKMHMTCSKMDTLTQQLVFTNKTGEQYQRSGVLHHLGDSLVLVWYCVEFFKPLFLQLQTTTILLWNVANVNKRMIHRGFHVALLSLHTSISNSAHVIWVLRPNKTVAMLLWFWRERIRFNISDSENFF